MAFQSIPKIVLAPLLISWFGYGQSSKVATAVAIWKVSLPSAAPLIFAGIKTALTFALIGAIVGEFVGASQGLGYDRKLIYWRQDEL